MTVETAPRRTEYVPLDHLQADPANPKAHNVDVIDASIGRFGIIDQIVRDDRTGYIISGHGRDETLRRMRDRGDTPPEGIRVDAGGHWLVPVIVGWSSRTDAEARAALIALNRTTELGGWVDESLLDLLDNLDDFTGVGFSEDDTDDLRARLEEVATEPVEKVTKKDDVPTQKDSDTYAAEGRRLVIIDYSVSEYPLIQARLKALRTGYGVDNNAEALSKVLEHYYPDVTAGDVEPELADVDPISEALGVETFDAEG
jgi:hypothetical protein